MGPTLGNHWHLALFGYRSLGRIRSMSTRGFPLSRYNLMFQLLPNRSPSLPSSISISTATTIVVFFATVAALYFGREVLVPIALAFLLSFVLAPIVRRFVLAFPPHRCGFHRGDFRISHDLWPWCLHGVASFPACERSAPLPIDSEGRRFKVYKAWRQAQVLWNVLRTF